MSQLNGDKARFQKDRKRKMLRRQRIEQLVYASRPHQSALAAASLHGQPRRETVKFPLS